MCFIYQFFILFIIMSSYLLEKISTNNFYNKSISFNHPIKSIIFVHNMIISEEEKNNYKNKYQIDSLCTEFNKICIPIIFNEYCDKLTENEKEKLKNISNDDNIWYHNLLNINHNIFS